MYVHNVLLYILSFNVLPLTLYFGRIFCFKLLSKHSVTFRLHYVVVLMQNLAKNKNNAAVSDVKSIYMKFFQWSNILYLIIYLLELLEIDS